MSRLVFIAMIGLLGCIEDVTRADFLGPAEMGPRPVVDGAPPRPDGAGSPPLLDAEAPIPEDAAIVPCDGVEAPPCNGCPAGAVVPEGWVCIPAGEFIMGSPATQIGFTGNDGPQHQVRITRPLLMMATEVTQAHWFAQYGTRPSANEGRNAACDQCPVENVTWFEGAEYANALSRAAGLEGCYLCGGDGAEGLGGARCDLQFRGLDCAGYRLPTEAEWEYAARAGTTTRFWSGSAGTDLNGVSWHALNSAIDGVVQTHPVAQLRANPWGLYDVHGNVWEFVYDWFGRYPAGLQVDPTGPATPQSIGGTPQRVGRGSSFDHGTDVHSVSHRGRIPPANGGKRVGLRMVRTLP
jgi:formylglycine-generating enzyme required for sulfatase activity